MSNLATFIEKVCQVMKACEALRAQVNLHNGHGMSDFKDRAVAYYVIDEYDKLVKEFNEYAEKLRLET